MRKSYSTELSIFSRIPLSLSPFVPHLLVGWKPWSTHSTASCRPGSVVLRRIAPPNLFFFFVLVATVSFFFSLDEMFFLEKNSKTRPYQ